jgi:hypothetical protein
MKISGRSAGDLAINTGLRVMQAKATPRHPRSSQFYLYHEGRTTETKSYNRHGWIGLVTRGS